MASYRPSDYKNPDYRPAFAERTERLEKLRADQAAWLEAGAEGRPPVERVMRYYAQPAHHADFIEDWVVTYDPRNLNANLPAFVPLLFFERQRELFTWLEERYSGRSPGLIEKSRDMGVSWVCLGFALCKWLFVPGISISFGSRKEEYVDKMGDPDSLLEKFRMAVRMLPREFQPMGWSEAAHARFMKIINPENGAIVSGEAGDNIGRGGRSSMYFVDEAAFIEHPDSVEASLSQNTDVRIDLSTPNGTGNPFYRKRMAGYVSVFTFHWRSDPRKGEAWYERKRMELEPEVLGQEVDLDYESSAGDVAIPAKYVHSSVSLRKLLAERGMLPKRVRGEEPVAGLDVGGGTAKSVFIARWGSFPSKPVRWSDADTTNTAGRARELAIRTGARILKFDSIGVGKGVAAGLKRMDGVDAQPINVGESPTNRTWPGGKRAKDKFTNLRAELWWTVREKLRFAYEHYLWMTTDGREGQKHELEEMLLLPDDQELISQLPVPKYSYTERGRIQIERKSQLKTRGVKSPDDAEALLLTFAPDPPRVRTGRVIGAW